jgi:hypothetical protein
MRVLCQCKIDLGCYTGIRWDEVANVCVCVRERISPQLTCFEELVPNRQHGCQEVLLTIHHLHRKEGASS